MSELYLLSLDDIRKQALLLWETKRLNGFGYLHNVELYTELTNLVVLTYE